jgi:hypothetical protein
LSDGYIWPQEFEDYLMHACTAVSPSERETLLTKWESAPNARMVSVYMAAGALPPLLTQSKHVVVML